MAELDMLVVNGSNTTCDDPETATKDWSICHGDSGGPLIDAETGKILGVASTSGSMRDGRKMSVYTDITSADAVRFIESVKHGQ
jgi:S1-C subfamily serine protease